MAKTIRFKVTPEEARLRFKKIWPILTKTYPDARIALEFKDPLQLLVATILSAQCTDARVNTVTRDLFRKYRKASDYVNVIPAELEQDIKSTGFYKNKAAHIQEACRTMMHDFNGEVPNTIEGLLTLSGVGRKTANCVLGDAFGIPGITCDTHVIRLSRRLGLSENRDPVKLEFDLADIVPKRNWTQFSHLLITHGRQICKARKPNCPECPVAGHCPAPAYPELM
jgi:endonuclease-3